jgi:hypothetical protein
VRLGIGDAFRFGLKRGSLHLFAASGGERLTTV